MLGHAWLAPTVLLAADVHRSGFRKLPRNLFCDWGFCVLEAAHGLEAWHQARKCEGRIDLLIAEQNLPFMGGLELAAHVRKLFPSVKGFADLAGDNRFLSCLTIVGCSPRTDRILAADEQTAQLAWDILRCLVSPLWLRARCFMSGRRCSLTCQNLRTLFQAREYGQRCQRQSSRPTLIGNWRRSAAAS